MSVPGAIRRACREEVLHLALSRRRASHKDIAYTQYLVAYRLYAVPGTWYAVDPTGFTYTRVSAPGPEGFRSHALSCATSAYT